jgi:transaldolase/glucose-6-phosphate isomerase
MGSTMFETFNLQPYQDEIQSGLRQAAQENLVRRLWEKDHTLWQDEEREVTNRLGWLEAPELAVSGVARWQELAAAFRRKGITQVVLLGMGGSSLAPEVFSRIFGPAPGFPSLDVLDSTAPEAVRRWRDSLDAKRTVFVVSSKSGTTIETISLFKFFSHLLEQILGPDRTGEHFLAITDPGSPLEETGRRLGFLDVVPGVPSIGGRYSVFSAFGLLPASLLGLEVKDIIREGRAMARLCRAENPPGNNPGLYLGTLMAGLAGRGLDKLTFLLPSALESFGGWLEQLVAESTGKAGRGILPVVGEAAGQPEAYGPDRFFVSYRLKGDSVMGATVEALKQAGKPGLVIDLQNSAGLAGQFFLWEMATAVAGRWLGINPFDQPDVTAAKKNTEAMLAYYLRWGRLPPERPRASGEGLDFFSQRPVASIKEGVRRFVNLARPGDYISLQAFLTPEPDSESALRKLADTLRRRSGVAVTVAFGPRYLHSTGQLHKGDAGRGLFFQFTSSHPFDLAVPESARDNGRSTYTFGVLIDAQARGDLQALRDAGRRIVRIHLGLKPAKSLSLLNNWLT